MNNVWEHSFVWRIVFDLRTQFMFLAIHCVPMIDLIDLIHLNLKLVSLSWKGRPRFARISWLSNVYDLPMYRMYVWSLWCPFGFLTRSHSTVLPSSNSIMTNTVCAIWQSLSWGYVSWPYVPRLCRQNQLKYCFEGFDSFGQWSHPLISCVPSKCMPSRVTLTAMMHSLHGVERNLSLIHLDHSMKRHPKQTWLPCLFMGLVVVCPWFVVL